MRFTLVLLGAVCAMPVVAQDYPNKPIRLIVPYPPGGGNDTISRLLAQKINESWGQQVIVDNR
ncbi:MAG: tripartite tricarboxylate transporter substrate binding protein, partial [Betaproteobacteria bacterium]